MKKLLLATALGTLLTACTSTTPPEPAPPTPSQPKQAALGAFVINIEDASSATPKANIVPLAKGITGQAAEVEGLTFKPLSFSTFNYLPTGKRYLRASFMMTNNSGAALNAPTILPLIMDGERGTIANTAISGLQYFDGSSAAEMAPQIQLGMAKAIDQATGDLIDMKGATLFKGPYDVSDLKVIPPANTTVTAVWPYGWAGSAQAAGQSQVMTIATELPLPKDPRLAPFKFSLSFTVIDAPTLK